MNKLFCSLCCLLPFVASAFDYTLIEYSAAMSATGTSQINAERGFVYAIDGSGLTDLGNGVFGHTATHANKMWMTSPAALSESAPKFYCVDLGDVYNLGKIKIWNFNMSGQAARGFKATEIYVTDNVDAAKASPADIRSWGDPVWQGELSKATGADEYTGCDPILIAPVPARYVGFVVTSSHGDNDYQGLSEVRFFSAPQGVPTITASNVRLNDSGNGFVASAGISGSSKASQITALAFAADDGKPVRVALGTAEPGATASGELTGLAADKTYAVRFEAANDVGTVTNPVSSASYVYHGALALAVAVDGYEKGCKAAEVKVSRAAADPYPVTVNYTVVGGDAVAGVDYVAPSGTVTIPAGETSAVIQIEPMVNIDRREDFQLTVSLANGLYFTTDASVQVTIYNAAVPDDANVWIAGSDSDGLASTAANWSKGMPRADAPESLVILVDGNYSSADMVWDADGENGLAMTVSSWTQAEAYNGTITFNTTYPTAASPFKLFEVAGAMTVDGGTITHPVSVVWDNDANKALTLAALRADYVYRLAIKAGSFSLGSGAKISAVGKGHSWRRVTGNVKVCFPSHGGRNEETSIGCYGNPKYPEDIGLASNLGSDSIGKTAVGGGAVKLSVTGTCAIDGEISVDGAASTGNLAAGAAGSVLIEASAVTGSGVIHADGVYCNNNSYKNGVGGRVALITDEQVDTTVLTVRAGGTSSGKYAAEGTVYLKDRTMTHGVLFLNNPLNTTSDSTPNRGSFVTNEEGVDWTFDAIRMNGHINLYVPSETTLTLPNGFASITAPDNAKRCSGIYCTGGAIDAGAGNQTLAGNWYFAPVSEYVFPADVALENGVFIGFCGYFEQRLNGWAAPKTNTVWTIRCSVAGDMTVASDCGFSTQEAGTVQQGGQQYAGVVIGSHGGRGSADGTTMDSVFDPVLSGVGQSNSYGYMKPGAAMIVKVGGKLTFDGIANANPVNNQGGGFQLAAGGAINFTVGELAGAGSFQARGFRDKQNGGRIAVKLTKPGADFSAFTGSFNVATVSGATKSTPGSIYLETAEEGNRCGTIYLDNRGTKTTTLSVPICANGYGADEVDAFQNAALVIRGGAYGQVTVANENGQFKMNSVTIEDNSKLDLNGNRFVVQSAIFDGARLKSGLYKATDEVVSSFISDTLGTGELQVIGAGLNIIIR